MSKILTSDFERTSTLLVIRASAHLRGDNEVKACDGLASNACDRTAMNFVAAVIRQDLGHTTVEGLVEMVLSPVALFDVEIERSGMEPAVLVGGNSDLVLRDEATITGETVIGNRSSLLIVDEPGGAITLDGDLKCVLYVQDESEPATPGYTRGVVTNRDNANVSGQVIGCDEDDDDDDDGD